MAGTQKLEKVALYITDIKDWFAVKNKMVDITRLEKNGCLPKARKDLCENIEQKRLAGNCENLKVFQKSDQK